MVAEHTFDEGVRLTASFGVSALSPGDGVADLVRRADGALYRAKRDGRNLVRTAELAPDAEGRADGTEAARGPIPHDGPSTPRAADPTTDL